MDKELLERLHVAESKSVAEISKLLNVSHYMITKHFRIYGIEYNPHSKTKPVLCSDVDKLRKLIEIDKLTYKDVAKHFDVSPSQICKWVASNKITPTVYEKTVPARDVLDTLYNEECKSLTEISKMYNVCVKTVDNWFKGLNIPTRSVKQAAVYTIPKTRASKLERHGYETFPPDMEFKKRSKAELEIESFLNSHGFDFKSNRGVLSGCRELDIYSETHKVAIEHCGTWYHSEKYRANNYHYMKYKECKDKGITLFTIFDFEWIAKKNILKSLLLSKLGKFERRIYARQCKIVEGKDVQFLNDNHLQGAPRNILKQYNLVYEGEVVGAVTYSKHHRNSNQVVLSRLCFKQNTQIIGGAAKLISNSITEFPEVISWSDNRYSTGDVYAKVGFKLQRTYRQDYFYTNGGTIKSKQSMKKSNIGCPADMTEHEFCNSLGWYRVYDCGKMVWIWSQEKAQN